MNIVNAQNEEKEFKKFLTTLAMSDEGDYVFDIDVLLKLTNYKDFLLVKKNNKIVDFVNIYQENGMKFISPNFTDYYIQLEELHLLKYSYPDCILECNEFFLNPEQKEYFKCKFDSRINKNYNYVLKSNYNYYATTEKRAYTIRDNFEKDYFKPLNLDNITFIEIKCSEINKILYNDNLFGIPSWTDGNNWSLAGFHYFTNEDKDKYAHYLLCMDDDNILGVIKHGVYDEYDTTHQCICYVDVNFAYRKNGISKLLARQMNTHLIDGLPLVITDESEMGAKCHMHQIFRENIDKKIYTYKELEELQYEKQIDDLRNYTIK